MAVSVLSEFSTIFIICALYSQCCSIIGIVCACLSFSRYLVDVHILRTLERQYLNAAYRT